MQAASVCCAVRARGQSVLTAALSPLSPNRAHTPCRQLNDPATATVHLRAALQCAQRLRSLPLEAFVYGQLGTLALGTPPMADAAPQPVSPSLSPAAPAPPPSTPPFLR